MIKYILEEENNNQNIFLVDEEYGIKTLVAVIFDKTHGRLIYRKLNEYVSSEKDNDPYVTKGLARITQN
jgi:hypothetical protein